MGLFQKLFGATKNIDKPKLPPSQWPDFGKDILPYYEGGALIHTNPPLANPYEEREKFYHAKFIVSDGVPYNLHDANSIQSIPLPANSHRKLKPEYENLGVTGSLEYVLQRKAGQLRESGEHELSIILLKKAHEFIWHNPYCSKKDFVCLVNWLLEDGRFDEAEAYRKEIERKFTVKPLSTGPQFTNYLTARKFKESLDSAKKFKIDYLKAADCGHCCGECAKYRNRIYCISGNDTRLPRIPTYQCTCNGIDFWVFHSNPTNEEIANSNRPFVDDRDDGEKRDYQYVLDGRIAEQCAYRDRVAYYKLRRLLPENEIPKNLGAFRRMKNGNTKNFQTLAGKAAQLGIDITLTYEERVALERYTAYCKEHGYKP